jgi:hypothetical protein
MARFGISCVVLSAMSSLQLVSQESARPNKSVFGVYGQPAPGHNSVQVTAKADGQIAVTLKLYYSTGHTCQLNKDAKWSEDHLAIVAEGLDESRPCRLNLFFENGHVLLKDEGLQCAPVYCGTRGKLDNVDLPKFAPNRK